jgi:hypothetical protein
MPNTQNDLRVLVFAPFGKDAALIEQVLTQSAVTISNLSSVQELEGAISEFAGAAIIRRSTPEWHHCSLGAEVVPAASLV